MSLANHSARTPGNEALGLVLTCSLAVLVSASSTVAEAQVVERVVAVVNGEAIFLSEVRRRAFPHVDHALREPTDLGPRAAIEQLYADALETMIDERLISQAAGGFGVHVSDAEVDRAIESVRGQSNLSRDRFWRVVDQMGFTPQEYREEVRRQITRLKLFGYARTRVTITPITGQPVPPFRSRRPRVALPGTGGIEAGAVLAELRQRAEIDIRLRSSRPRRSSARRRGSRHRER